MSNTLKTLVSNTLEVYSHSFTEEFIHFDSDRSASAKSGMAIPAYTYSITNPSIPIPTAVADDKYDRGILKLNQY
jgi:hypothetical protein